MIMEALMSLLGSSAVGSLIGGIFAWLNRKADVAAKSVDYEHERGRWAHEIALKAEDREYAKLEAQGRKDVAIEEGNAKIEAARMATIGAIASAEAISPADIKAAGWWGFLLIWASAFNKLIRPVLTVILAGAALYLNWLVIEMMTNGWSEFTTDTKFQIGMQAFSWVTAQASMAFAYWFVSRGTGK